MSRCRRSARTRAPGSRRVDPVVWTKLFAMIPLPVQGAGEGRPQRERRRDPVLPPDGRAARPPPRTTRELGARGDAVPAHASAALARLHRRALAREPIADYVREPRDRELSDSCSRSSPRPTTAATVSLRAIGSKHLRTWRQSFKTGRSSTVTGFSGLFEDRAWETVDASFEAARARARERSTPAVADGSRASSDVEDLCSRRAPRRARRARPRASLRAGRSLRAFARERARPGAAPVLDLVSDR